MAIGMTKVTEQEVFASISIAAAAFEWASVEAEGTEINVATTEQVIDCMLQIKVTFASGATLPAELHLRYSNDGGTTLDTEDVKTFATSIDSVDDDFIIISHRVPGMFDYLDVGIKNTEAATYAVTVLVDATYTKLTGLTAA
jgi:hypothetical protein